MVFCLSLLVENIAAYHPICIFWNLVPLVPLDSLSPLIQFTSESPDLRLSQPLLLCTGPALSHNWERNNKS